MTTKAEEVVLAPIASYELNLKEIIERNPHSIIYLKDMGIGRLQYLRECVDKEIERQKTDKKTTLIAVGDTRSWFRYYQEDNYEEAYEYVEDLLGEMVREGLMVEVVMRSVKVYESEVEALLRAGRW